MSWHCMKCGKEVHPKDVTYYETHDRRAGGCGGPVYWERDRRISVEKGVGYVPGATDG